MQDLKSEYASYEEVFFGKIKGLYLFQSFVVIVPYNHHSHYITFLVFDGVYFRYVYAEGVVIAASHPVITSGVGLGLIVLQSTVQSSTDHFILFCLDVVHISVAKTINLSDISDFPPVDGHEISEFSHNYFNFGLPKNIHEESL